MNSINRDYLYTDEWIDLAMINIGKNDLYLYAHDPEDRSSFCANQLISTNPNGQFIQLEIDNQDMMSVNDSEECK